MEAQSMPKQTFLNLPDDKQKRILECAIDEFAEKGYRAASISCIVKTAGIAKGSFYQYFEDKEDLYGFVVESAIVRRKLKISSDESVKLETLNLTQFIRVLFRTMMHEFLDQPKLLKIGTDLIRDQSAPVQKRIYGKYEHLQQNYFQAFILHGKNQGTIDPNVDEDVLGNMLTGIGFMIGNFAAVHGYENLTEEYIDDIVDKIEYIFINGIYRSSAE